VARKILGQAAPGATAEAVLYTVPVGKQTTVSSLVICNRDINGATFNISCSVGGASTVSKDYLYYNLSISGGDTFVATIGGTFAANDVIRVYATTANLSFTAFGDES
jgi:hypothetical protein